MASRTYVAVAMAAAAAFGPTPAAAAQDWLLNPTLSHFYMQTAKANSIIEIQQFQNVEGSINGAGDATVKIDLLSIKSGIDIRDVRMRFLLFETYKYAFAEVSAKLDMDKLHGLLTTTRMPYDIMFKVNLHGVEKDVPAQLNVTRLSDTTIDVATAKPIVVRADAFGLDGGIAKLSEAINGTPIVAAASITFDLVFETGDKLPQIQAVTYQATARRIEEETAAITPEKCQTRFAVISAASAIYFRTGSAELDPASEPILNSVGDIANRCPSVNFQISGHTDNVGARNANQALSDQRAHAVLTYLVGKGVVASRIKAAGFGDTKPVAANDTDANRGKNRRIEFSVLPR